MEDMLHHGPALYLWGVTLPGIMDTPLKTDLVAGDVRRAGQVGGSPTLLACPPSASDALEIDEGGSLVYRGFHAAQRNRMAPVFLSQGRGSRTTRGPEGYTHADNMGSGRWECRRSYPIICRLAKAANLSSANSNRSSRRRW
jgi:hypothetical protein